MSDRWVAEDGQPIPPTAARETPDYTLQNFGGESPWRAEFADATFFFRILAIAETAIAALRKTRKASHPNSTTLSKRAPSCVFFTHKRQCELFEDKTEPAIAEAVAA